MWSCIMESLACDLTDALNSNSSPSMQLKKCHSKSSKNKKKLGSATNAASSCSSSKRQQTIALNRNKILDEHEMKRNAVGGKSSMHRTIKGTASSSGVVLPPSQTSVAQHLGSTTTSTSRLRRHNSINSFSKSSSSSSNLAINRYLLFLKIFRRQYFRPLKFVCLNVIKFSSKCPLLTNCIV